MFSSLTIERKEHEVLFQSPRLVKMWRRQEVPILVYPVWFLISTQEGDSAQNQENTELGSLGCFPDKQASLWSRAKNYNGQGQQLTPQPSGCCRLAGGTGSSKMPFPACSTPFWFLRKIECQKQWGSLSSWRELVTQEFSFDFTFTGTYVSYLILHSQAKSLLEVWKISMYRMKETGGVGTEPWHTWPHIIHPLEHEQGRVFVVLKKEWLINHEEKGRGFGKCLNRFNFIFGGRKKWVWMGNWLCTVWASCTNIAIDFSRNRMQLCRRPVTILSCWDRLIHWHSKKPQPKPRKKCATNEQPKPTVMRGA